MFRTIFFIIQACVKSKNTTHITRILYIEINNIIKFLDYSKDIAELLLDESDNDISLYALNDNFVLFKIEGTNRIIKIYNKKEDFNTELTIFNKLKGNLLFPQIVDFYENDNVIILEQIGNLLLDNFKLPVNWKEQLQEIFNTMTERDILHCDFNINNIYLYNDKIYIINFIP